MTALRVNLKTEKVVEKAACEIIVGDRAKLGGRWHRVTRVDHYEPATGADIERTFAAVIEAKAYSELRLYEAVRDLHAALSNRQRSPEPYVEIFGGSATTYWNKRYSPSEVVKVIVLRDQPVSSGWASGEGNEPVTMSNPRLSKRNVRRIYLEAMVAGDEETLERVYAYLVNQGWAGGISVEEAIEAVERG